MPRPRKQRFSQDDEDKLQETENNSGTIENGNENPDSADNVNSDGHFNNGSENQEPVKSTDANSNQDNGDEVDLQNLLNKKTEKKDFSVKTEEKINPEDFDDEAGKTKPNDPGATNPNEPKELTYHESAKLLLGTIEGIMQLLLPIGYRNKKFTAEERKRVNELRYVRNQEYSEEDKALYSRALELQELIKNIPFNKEERKNWIVPAAATLEKYGWKPGPELSLIFATALIMIPRLTPLADD